MTKNILKKQIPNIITSANLLCGCIAITYIAKGALLPASLLVLAAAFFDFFDGMAARLLKVGSPLGAELDSLADVVSFGLVPAYMVFTILLEISTSNIIPFLAFSIAISSAYRLAKFNIDERQTESFIGLPTPANALFWISLPLIEWKLNQGYGLVDSSWLYDLIMRESSIIILVALLSYLLIAEIPLMSLKVKSLKWSENKSRFLLIGLSILFILLFDFASIPFILILYFIISFIENRTSTHEI